MKFLRQICSVFISFLFCLALCDVAFAADQAAPVAVSPTHVTAPPVSAAPVLPTEFAGWQLKGAVAKSDDPAVADATN
ncbi:MAG: hypothetical protein WA804_09415, partial [Terriglobales bacterium]